MISKYFLSVLFTFSMLMHTNAQKKGEKIHKPEDIYQFSTSFPIIQPDGKVKNSTNYLWVPPHAKIVRAIIISSQNVLEQWIDEHPLIREVCNKNDIAILYSCPGFYTENKDRSIDINGKNVIRILDSLAFISGYAELKTIPWICFGHSGTNNLVRELLKNYSDRILTAFTLKGGPGLEGKKDVPVMCTAGEYFEWNQQNEDLIHPIDTIKNYQNVIKERSENNTILSYFFDPNTGHFDCSKQLTELIAMHIGAAFQARIDEYDGLLRVIDLNSGWVTGLPLPGGLDIKPTPYAEAGVFANSLPWYFNKKIALKAYQMAKVNFKREPQIAGFSNLDGTVAGFYKGIVWPISYETKMDGTSFTLKPVFWKAIPDTFKNAGTILGRSKHTPYVVLLCGNAKHIGENNFEVFPGRSYKSSATYFIVKTPGDDIYRSSIEPGQLVLKENTTGMDNVIHFDEVPNISIRQKQIELHATSTSGLPVKYFVKTGPAYISNNTLVLSNIPRSAKYPIQITVVAYQWGRSMHPQVKTAQHVEHTFFVSK